MIARKEGEMENRFLDTGQMGSANKKYTGVFLPQDMKDGGLLLISLTLRKIREDSIKI